MASRTAILVCAAADLAAANAACNAAGLVGPDNLSVPLSPDGTGSPTQYAGHAAGITEAQYTALASRFASGGRSLTDGDVKTWTRATSDLAVQRVLSAVQRQARDATSAVVADSGTRTR